MPLLNIDIWEIVKWFVVFGQLLYLVFAFVIIKQVRAMRKALDIGFSYPIGMIAYGHFFFALGVIIISIIIL